MFLNYVLLFCTLIASVFAQTSSTGKINSNSPSADPAANQPADPQVQNYQQQFNQGIQPYSYGYNTGIRPYSYSYTYPQQNGGKPQITYQNLQQQPQPQQPQPQYQGMMPMQPAYYGQQGYPPMQPMGYGYPPMQPQMQFQPMPMNGPPPTIPPIPELANLGGDFDLSNLGGPATNAAGTGNANANNANQQANANPLGDFNLDNLAVGPAGGGSGGNAANSNQNNAGGMQAPDLNAELANLADPSGAVAGGSGGGNNQANNGAGLPAGVPQGLGDFNIDGLGSDRLTNTNNNQANNPMTGLPDIQSLMGGGGGSPGPGDFADLTSLANLANSNPIGQSASPVARTATTGNAPASGLAGLPDFNFGGSNNNLDFNINNMPSASNLDFDLNFPSPSELKPTKLKSDKLQDSSKNKKQPPPPLAKLDKKETNKKEANARDRQDGNQQQDKPASGKRLIKNRRRRSPSNEQLETAESLQAQGLQDLELDPDSPRGMLNINPQYQNPYQGVYSQYPAYRIM